MMKTSGTDKNPGRLFHACPFGSELVNLFNSYIAIISIPEAYELRLCFVFFLQG